ncbi:MAG TPA: DEAD/DEAH box helicase family protein [Microvirga sp.]|nr:DEAD/DEAH box helicase family protein [Microvirga sp.]
MATGAGKTRTCIALMYRRLKHRRFRRILFLVDRTALGDQTTDALEMTELEGSTSSRRSTGAQDSTRGCRSRRIRSRWPPCAHRPDRSV